MKTIALFLAALVFSACQMADDAQNYELPPTLVEGKPEHYPLIFNEAMSLVKNQNDTRKQYAFEAVKAAEGEYEVLNYLNRDSLLKATSVSDLVLTGTIHTVGTETNQAITKCQAEAFEKFASDDFLISCESSHYTGTLLGLEKAKEQELEYMTFIGQYLFSGRPLSAGFVADMKNKNIPQKFSKENPDPEVRFLLKRKKTFGSEPKELWLLNQLLTLEKKPEDLEFYRKLVEARSELSLAYTVKFILQNSSFCKNKKIVLFYGKDHLPHYKKILEYYKIPFQIIDLESCN